MTAIVALKRPEKARCDAISKKLYFKKQNPSHDLASICRTAATGKK